MNGILKEIGGALIELQNSGEVTIRKTEEIYVEETLFYVEDTLKGLKAAYKKEELEDGSVKIKLQ